MRNDLVEFVMDVRNDPSRRRQVLLRLPQLEAGAPERLDDLLYLCGGGMDEIAATVAAIEGRNVAMSLVVDLAESMARSKYEPAISDGHPLVELAAHAALALCGDDPEAHAAAREILGDETVPFADPEVAPQAEQSLRQAVAAGLRRVMESTPELLDTPFERDRRLAWERAAALVAATPASVSELTGLPDDEIDLAMATLSFAHQPRPASAEPFERMMILLERDVRAVSEPEAVVATIRARLCGPQRRLAHVGYDGLASDLWSVMRLQCGSCVGGTILWTAIADRLDLPIRPVWLPGHCAVVWDDGRRRMILETTARAGERDLAFFRDVQPLADRQDAPDAQVLRPLSKMGLLSLRLSNSGVAALSSWYVQSEETWRYGLRNAELALVLNPENRLAVTVAAELAAQLDDVEMERTLARLDVVAADPACSSYERFGFAKAYLACGETKKADEQLRPVEERHADDPHVEGLRERLGD